jgi:hypothetical protein
MRPFFGYYGGKWRDAPKLYPGPKHDVIVEAFAGSAGYSVRNCDRKVVLCDIDPIIAGLWAFLIRVSPSDVLRLPDLPEGAEVDDLAVCQEARWLVGFWLNRATATPRRSPSSWMRSGVRPGSFWGERVRQTIAEQVERIRHWEVFCCSYEDCPVKGQATWLIDPPYQDAGIHYRFGSSGIDYTRLGAWSREREGQVIVSENEGASWLPFEPAARTRTTSGGRSREAIWLSEATP